MSPSRAGCDADLTLTLNSSQVSATVFASETLPESACAKWLDKMASQGLEATISGISNFSDDVVLLIR